MGLQRIEFGVRDASADAGCCGGGACDYTPPAQAPHAGEVTTDLLVEGMTCEHCVRAVTAEVGQVDGVGSVEVELVPSGASRVRVHSERTPDQAALIAAIEEAGYSLQA